MLPVPGPAVLGQQVALVLAISTVLACGGTGTAACKTPNTMLPDLVCMTDAEDICHHCHHCHREHAAIVIKAPDEMLQKFDFLPDPLVNVNGSYVKAM
jgi:hypothetical protein